jgi:RNA polymerase sigma factor (sigma-70 family)
MEELRAKAGPGSLGLAELGTLCDLPVEERCARLLRHDAEGLAAAVRKLKGMGAGEGMDVDRLAWAVAFNMDGAAVEGLAASEVNGRAGRGGAQGYRSRFPLNTAWSSIWAILVRPLAREGSEDGETLLSELALSVACEQRGDWQHPGARALDSDAAHRAFEFVHERNRQKVLGACRGFAGRGGEPEWIAHEAWSRVFCDYWSARAPRRFLGLSCISTMVCGVARHIAFDAARHQARMTPSDEDPSDDRSGFVKKTDGGFDPTARIESDQLYRRARVCMDGLPARRRIVAEMVWFRQIGASRVAGILGVSEAAISQHLKKARDLVGMCLKQHGFHLPS